MRLRPTPIALCAVLALLSATAGLATSAARSAPSVGARVTAQVAATDAADIVPFDSERWRYLGDAARVEEHLGRQALSLQGGMALIEDDPFTDGVIEYDIAFGPDRNFVGAVWRAREGGTYENFYIRPHQSGNPDANQYTPVFHGVSGWQLYHGPGYGEPVTYRHGEWIRVRIVVSGTRGEVYVDSDEPVLVMHDLKVAGAGGVGLLAGQLAPVWYSNFAYRKLDAPPLRGTPVEPEPAAPGTVMYWEISSPFAESAVAEAVTLEGDLADGLTWEPLPAEPTGITNLARLRGISEGADTVFARVRLRAAEDRIVRARFGYSDRVRVFLNGRLLYSGGNDYLSRDYRYLGTIGLFDEVALPLRAGDNDLRFAVSESFGGWGILCRLDDLAGIEITQ